MSAAPQQDVAVEPADFLPVEASKRQRGLPFLAKRLIDIVGASIVLFVTSPISLFVALAIRIDSRGPAIYRATRIGKCGDEFTMFKFRSMQANADESLHRAYLERLMRDKDPAGPDAEPDMFKLDEDPRITRVGRWIRRLSIDELPQLLNVLRGDMSLVGPRPEVPSVLEIYQPEQFRRFSVLPGMTGLWQVNGRGELPPNEMIRLDIEYADNWRLRDDISILLQTPAVVLKKTGAR